MADGGGLRHHPLPLASDSSVYTFLAQKQSAHQIHGVGLARNVGHRKMGHLAVPEPALLLESAYPLAWAAIHRLRLSYLSSHRRVRIFQARRPTGNHGQQAPASNHTWDSRQSKASHLS